jgi:RimJ/RimL family protein N-acetyltransferase
MEVSGMEYSRYFWQGETVRLRPMREEDAERVYEASLDSEARRFLQLGVELPTSVETLREELAKRARCKPVNGVIVFGIETHEGDYVGAISLHSRDPKNGSFGFGVSIASEHRRRGYAADAVRLLLRYAFEERRFHKCNSGCVESNAASIALHRRLGFVEEGCRRQRWFLDGRYQDDVLFGLTRDEYRAGL